MSEVQSLSEKPVDTISPIKKVGQKILSLAILCILFATIIAGTSESMHSKMLSVGANVWDNYFILRGDEPVADCALEINIDARLTELAREHALENTDFSLFETEFDRGAAKNSLVNQLTICSEQHKAKAIYLENMSMSVSIFRAIEHSLAAISLFAIDKQKLSLILLLVLAAIVTTWKRGHIAFKSIRSQFDHYLSNSAQFVANACLGVSTYAFYQGSSASGTEVNNPELMIILLLGCIALCVLNLYQMKNPQEGLSKQGSLLTAVLTIPIHTFMLLAAAFHFFVTESHLPGISIYFTQVFQLTNLHLAIGLYILVGMLLKETLFGAKLFDVFKPWHMPPEMLAFVAIGVMAFPTAYTGASGIIIIAMGAVVYQEMRRVGTRRQLSLAVTAMTGSGVVLRPCLLVVGIAILNKEVVTDELFHWGFRVFILSMVVFAVFAMITRKDPMKLTPAKVALIPSLKMLGPLMPYILILAGILVFYDLALNAYLDEFSAPTILPIIIIAIVIFERCFSKDFHERNKTAGASPTVSSAFSSAVDNSALQIGAILMLMACSFTVGGIIERGGGILLIPEGFTSIYAAMAFLVIFLIGIGMIMDPFGALILVTGTIAPVAYSQGIHPIHFWMTCLMAFELGYLSPPVSLNHLLTRQVVGDDEVALALKEGDTFYYRHERILLPLLVMGTTLLLVAFVPLFVMAP
jgi:TRAP-type C4-dicarboxylate transport system permease large subunit